MSGSGNGLRFIVLWKGVLNAVKERDLGEWMDR